MFDFVTRVKSLARIEYLNLTFREAAKATGVSKSTLARWSPAGPCSCEEVRASPETHICSRSKLVLLRTIVPVHR
jgi:RES domain-containing protein